MCKIVQTSDTFQTVLERLMITSSVSNKVAADGSGGLISGVAGASMLAHVQRNVKR